MLSLMKFKIDYKVGDYFSGVLLETFKEKGINRPRVRAMEIFSDCIRVEFPRSLREDNPIGTQLQDGRLILRTSQKRKQKNF